MSQPNASDTGNPQPNASDTENAQGGEQEQDRKDVAMADDKKEQKAPPEASQRARGMKNQKLNPYLVEKLLKDLEEREKEVQLRYRNDPQRREDLEDMDPFFMDSDQLREFFQRRQGIKPKKPQSDEPDW